MMNRTRARPWRRCSAATARRSGHRCTQHGGLVDLFVSDVGVLDQEIDRARRPQLGELFAQLFKLLQLPAHRGELRARVRDPRQLRALVMGDGTSAHLAVDLSDFPLPVFDFLQRTNDTPFDERALITGRHSEDFARFLIRGRLHAFTEFGREKASGLRRLSTRPSPCSVALGP